LDDGKAAVSARRVTEMTRPLEGLIETMSEFEGGPDPLGYWMRGHVDKAEFAAEVRAYCAELDGKADWWDRFPYEAVHVEHTYYRNVPVGPDFPGQMLMYPCDAPGRGAYPVTFIDRACGNYRYEESAAAAPTNRG